MAGEQGIFLLVAMIFPLIAKEPVMAGAPQWSSWNDCMNRPGRRPVSATGLCIGLRFAAPDAFWPGEFIQSSGGK